MIVQLSKELTPNFVLVVGRNIFRPYVCVYFMVR